MAAAVGIEMERMTRDDGWRFLSLGRYIERLGYFNPLLPKEKTERLKLDLEKVKSWLDKGALPSDRVLRFLDAAGIRQALIELRDGLSQGTLTLPPPVMATTPRWPLSVSSVNITPEQA